MVKTYKVRAEMNVQAESEEDIKTSIADLLNSPKAISPINGGTITPKMRVTTFIDVQTEQLTKEEKVSTVNKTKENRVPSVNEVVVEASRQRREQAVAGAEKEVKRHR